ncbi:uncharacterized protein BDR25DRAFT_352010 [Lindgomyces ingoldianus]|uniref:Uncharacterized protein n=1 Tax=Lindgomyces ingoldianus TaxID=673940 RepID=A0ACB6R5E2_9PLEO|nr:uncharacterized protein BDR25DRAFT_352010 [Lindgomyces ingoldianus]KAF2474459.1 hypothetical protein BDR25DRAFT_352010 [Lindgomyces ingoldianus]
MSPSAFLFPEPLRHPKACEAPIFTHVYPLWSQFFSSKRTGNSVSKLMGLPSMPTSEDSQHTSVSLNPKHPHQEESPRVPEELIAHGKDVELVSIPLRSNRLITAPQSIVCLLKPVNPSAYEQIPVSLLSSSNLPWTRPKTELSRLPTYIFHNAYFPQRIFSTTQHPHPLPQDTLHNEQCKAILPLALPDDFPRRKHCYIMSTRQNSQAVQILAKRFRKIATTGIAVRQPSRPAHKSLLSPGHSNKTDVVNNVHQPMNAEAMHKHLTAPLFNKILEKQQQSSSNSTTAYTTSMYTPSYYTVLGLAPNAPAGVIRAAYKALVLIYHPDKTVHFATDERVKYASMFQKVQQAYDVLSNPVTKAEYDNGLDLEHRSSEISSSQSSKGNNIRSAPARCLPILTTTAKRAAIRAKLSSDRIKRDKGEAHLPLDGLQYTLQIWRGLAEERRSVPTEHTHCMIKIYEYEEKVKAREAEVGYWLDNIGKTKIHQGSYSRDRKEKVKAGRAMGAPKSTPSTRSSTPKRGLATSKSRLFPRNEASTRAKEKVRQDAAKLAQLDVKATTVNTEKEKQKQNADQAATQHADRIAKARVNPALNVSSIPEDQGEEEVKQQVASWKRECSKCGGSHRFLAEWKKCSIQALQEQVEQDDQNTSVYAYEIFCAKAKTSGSRKDFKSMRRLTKFAYPRLPRYLGPIGGSRTRTGMTN